MKTEQYFRFINWDTIRHSQLMQKEDSFYRALELLDKNSYYEYGHEKHLDLTAKYLDLNKELVALDRKIKKNLATA